MNNSKLSVKNVPIEDTVRSGRKDSSIKRLMLLIVVVFIFSFLSNPIYVHADNGSTKVHITRTGSCYHRANCSYLKSDIETTLYDAAVVKGLSPCSRCHPPEYSASASAETNLESYKDSNSRNTSSSTRSSSSEKSKEFSTFDWIILIVLGGPFAIAFLSGILGFGMESFTNLKNKRDNSAQTREKWEQDRLKYLDMYAGKDPISLVELPQGAFIKDGLPCTDHYNLGVYGDYTFYVGAKNNKVFHTDAKCGGAYLVPKNYCYVWQLQPCPVCARRRHVYPKLKWYYDYQEIVRIKKEYNIP